MHEDIIDEKLVANIRRMYVGNSTEILPFQRRLAENVMAYTTFVLAAMCADITLKQDMYGVGIIKWEYIEHAHILKELCTVLKPLQLDAEFDSSRYTANLITHSLLMFTDKELLELFKAVNKTRII